MAKSHTDFLQITTEFDEFTRIKTTRITNETTSMKYVDKVQEGTGWEFHETQNLKTGDLQFGFKWEPTWEERIQNFIPNLIAYFVRDPRLRVIVLIVIGLILCGGMVLCMQMMFESIKEEEPDSQNQQLFFMYAIFIVILWALYLEFDWSYISSKIASFFRRV